jgi:hypothetical protein
MLWNQFLDDGDCSFVYFQTNYLLGFLVLVKLILVCYLSGKNV